MLSSSFGCDQIYNVRYDFGRTVVLLKSDLNVEQTTADLQLLFGGMREHTHPRIVRCNKKINQFQFSTNSSLGVGFVCIHP
jgi:hypothetical protein